jgi:multicomponent Na+:H+ antiporter subunit E
LADVTPGNVGFVLERWAALFCWAYLTWTTLSWTFSVEQIAVGVALSALAAAICAPLGPVAGPWKILRPRRAIALARLGWYVLVRMVQANVALSRRIWARRMPLPSGMLVVPTAARTDGALTVVGVLTSVIVDSQLVDVDRDRSELQYHVVSVESTGPQANRRRINAPIEERLTPVVAP